MNVVKFKSLAAPEHVMLAELLSQPTGDMIVKNVVVSRDNPGYQLLHGWTREEISESQIVPAGEYEVVRVNYPNDVVIYEDVQKNHSVQ